MFRTSCKTRKRERRQRVNGFWKYTECNIMQTYFLYAIYTSSFSVCVVVAAAAVFLGNRSMVWLPILDAYHTNVTNGNHVYPFSSLEVVRSDSDTFIVVVFEYGLTTFDFGWCTHCTVRFAVSKTTHTHTHTRAISTNFQYALRRSL